MECPLCGFANLPGTERCTRCRAQLVATEPSAAADFLPPRAGRLKGLRPLLYAVNRLVVGRKSRLLARIGRFFDRNGSVPGEAVAATILSVVPGLGHLAIGRRLGALVAFLGWAFTVFITANFYAGVTGGLLLGSLIGWHASVIFDAGKLQQHLGDVRDRLTTMFFILVITAIPYFLLDRLVMSYVEFVVSPFNIEALDIRQGDVLLSWRGRYVPGHVHVGDVVYVNQDWAYGAYYHGGGPTGLGRVVAVGGDKVCVSQAGIEVNGQPVEASAMPGGQFLWPSRPLSFTVPHDAVFVPRPVGYHGYHLVNIVVALWREGYTVRLAQVRGRVSGVYLPLGRRHALR
ncbi:MAG: hypothetical protein FJ291_12100 [Planctomycetes bacterium]|nr:hypothetical protein [Planctomycetota bacterium]